MQSVRVVAGLALALAAAGPVAAQQDSPERLAVFVHGGATSPLNALNRTGSSKLTTGLVAGGGLALSINQYFGVRAVASRAENDVRHGDTKAGWGYSRTYVGGELQVKVPTGTRAMPYAVLGGGAVSVAPDDGEKQTKAQYGGGLGVRVSLGDGRFGAFAESRGVLHKQEVETSGLGVFNRSQVDVTWSVGVAARLF